MALKFGNMSHHVLVLYEEFLNMAPWGQKWPHPGVI
jgi:hypothetical protein